MLSENQLDEWVRSHAEPAQGLIAELVARLVTASSPGATERRFPRADSIGQHGPDGDLTVQVPFEPFIPQGRSLWEIGTNLDARRKATHDYSHLVTSVPAWERASTTFIFVTPYSARRGWSYTSKVGEQTTWLSKRRARNQWADVRIIDGTKLVEWLQEFPAIGLWLAEQTLGIPASHVEPLERRWVTNSSYGAPPPLSPEVFLLRRDEARAKLDQVLTGEAQQLQLQTHFPGQVADFAAAHVAALDERRRAETFGRCLIVSSAEAWSASLALRARHVLFAESPLELTGDLGAKLMQRAVAAGHAVVVGIPRGGRSSPETLASLASPKSLEVQQALEQAGYAEERARIIANKSDGNLGSMLRCLQNQSTLPDWATSNEAEDLTMAHLLGSWHEGVDSDRAAAQELTAVPYTAWIANIRALALQPATPISHREGVWRALLRYEGWYALGPRVFDTHLDRIRTVAVSVLSEPHPKLELPSQERFAAALRGKSLRHSAHLRRGIASTIALLGSHANALSSCSLGRAESTAVLVLRDLLRDATWQRWASLHDELPLLAEAAPVAFLDAVELALRAEPCPFDTIFAQEGDGFLDGNYMSGVLWALETLAWDSALLGRVALLLGELASRDPGGRFANRPSQSLVSILLAWFPQTNAPIEQRTAVVEAVMRECPEAGWELVLALLSPDGGLAMGTRRPEWRDLIPEEWVAGATPAAYRTQVEQYLHVALAAAMREPSRLASLTATAEGLPPAAFLELTDHLRSEAVTSLPEGERYAIWCALTEQVTKHKKFADADWAMEAARVERLFEIAALLRPSDPTLLYRQLFAERDFELYDDTGDWQSQASRLEERRDAAIATIAAKDGVNAVVSFARDVESPVRVGVALGAYDGVGVDAQLPPSLLESEQASDERVVAGFVWRRFRRGGWRWVDELAIDRWSNAEIGRLLVMLPFVRETWDRVDRLLGDDRSIYWSATVADPYDFDEDGSIAVELLLQHGRPLAAVRCLERMRHDKQEFHSALAIRALAAAPVTFEPKQAQDSYHLVELIKWLQENPDVERGAIMGIEWAFLQLLDRRSSGGPRTLATQLATDPAFFAEMVRVAHASRLSSDSSGEASGANATAMANARRLFQAWRTPPGFRPNAPFDGETLGEWVSAARAECSKFGILEHALELIGQVLVHVPPDADGLWIHRAAARLLNERDASELREGFRIATLNARGVHWVDPTGAPELALASNYREKAAALDRAGISRFAATLREVEGVYAREADRLRSQHARND